MNTMRGRKRAIDYVDFLIEIGRLARKEGYLKDYIHSRSLIAMAEPTVVI